jgi:tetratricopeptide (TPR) repeat protein
VTPLLFAQSPASGTGVGAAQWWWTLELGKGQFRAGQYGDALATFETAVTQRQDTYKQFYNDMITMLSKPDAIPLGDDLQQVEGFVKATNQTEAQAALNELDYRVGLDTMHDSVKAVLAALQNLENYPEADYWIGECYRVEGEPAMALTQYNEALKHADLFEKKGFDIDILYSMAAVYQSQGSNVNYESTLLAILNANDPSGAARGGLWAQENDTFARSSMVRILTNNGIDRFLSLYRDDNTESLKAHTMLGMYYYQNGKYDEASQQLMYAFLIPMSFCMEKTSAYDATWEYSTIDGLFSKMRGARPLQSVLKWLADNDFYKTAYFFACSLFASSRNKPASDIWTFLAGLPAGNIDTDQWRSRSILQTHSPAIDLAY